MIKQLNAIEARILGVMLEKQVTTPDQYPLSLNALSLGCNQKSNREPVVNYSEAEVLDAVKQLIDKRLLSEAPLSGRVARYQQRLCNSEFGELKLSEQERAILCLLLLRGPQTAGELRTRSGRLAEFASVNEVEACLQVLSEWSGQALVQRLPREPGKRESRYAHLLSDEALEVLENEHEIEDHQSLAQLRDELEVLREQVNALQVRLEQAGL